MKKLSLTIVIAVACFLAVAHSSQAARRPGHFSDKSLRSSTLKCSSIVDMNRLPTMLYKNENVHGGRGRTLLDQGERFGRVRSLSIAGANGTIIGCFGLWACDAPYHCRYYQQMCHDNLSNSQFVAAAKRTGGMTVHVGKGSGICYSFPANSGRYGNVVK